MSDFPIDLVRHLESYRFSLRREIPEEVAWYATQFPSKDPANYRTVFDYLTRKLKDSVQAAGDDDEDEYTYHLQQHQDGFLAILDYMLADEMWDYNNISKSKLQDLLKNRGWKWFKYSRFGFSAEMKVGKRVVDVAFLPRYSSNHIQTWDGKCKTYLDATEMGFLFPRDGEAEPSDEEIEDILAFKLKNPAEKIIEIDWKDPPILKHLSITDLNRGPLVYDWSLPLWG